MTRLTRAGRAAATRAAAGRPRLKMQDLERATGVGRETIRFYIRQGLLPEPERPGRNVAWYDQSFVERIGLIKQLQRKRFLPLHVIKAIVASDTPPSRDEVKTLLALDGRLFPAVRGVPATPPERLDDLARRTRLPPGEIHRLVDAGVIEVAARDGEHWLEDHAIRIVELWSKLRDAGYTEALGFGPEDLRLYVDVVRWLAREELRRFTQGIVGRVETEQSARMAEAGITHVAQIIAVLREATLLRYVAAGNVPEPLPTGAPRTLETAVTARRRAPSSS